MKRIPAALCAAFLLLATMAGQQASVVGNEPDRLKARKVADLPTAGVANRIRVVTDGSSSSDCTIGGGANAVLCRDNGTAWAALGGGGGGSGDVVGPSSATDNAVARFDGATGKLIQNSTCTISDAGVLTCAQLNLTGGIDMTDQAAPSPPASGHHIPFSLNGDIGLSQFDSSSCRQSLGAFLINATSGTTYTYLACDRFKLTSFSNAAAKAVTLPQAGTTGFETDKIFFGQNKNLPQATITPTTSTIDGYGSLILRDKQEVGLRSDGTNFTTFFNNITPSHQVRQIVQRTTQTIADNQGAFNTLGDSQTITGACINVTVAAGNPVMSRCQQSAATINTNAGIEGAVNIYRTGRNMRFSWGGGGDVTDIRWFAGFSDQTLATMVNADNPAGNYAGFTICQDAAAGCTADQTTWRCVLKDNTTQNKIDTAVTADTVYHAFEVWEETPTSKWHFFIDGVEVCGTGTSTNAPLANTNMKRIIGQQTLIALKKNMDIAHNQVVIDNK